MDTPLSEHPTAKSRREIRWLKQTLITSALSVVSVLAGVIGSGWFTERDKRHELEIAANRRAIESVESITSLIFERDARAELIASSIRRSAPSDELKERKKLYDDVFIRYNSSLQSWLFNIRDKFNTTNYNIFEDILMNSVQERFIEEDRCITNAYDAMFKPVSSDSQRQATMVPKTKPEVLQHCFSIKSDAEFTFDDLHKAILRCEYNFSDKLFKVVASPGGLQDMVATSKDEIAQACIAPAGQPARVSATAAASVN